MRRLAALVIIGVVGVVRVPGAVADELKLANGDTINGDVVEWAVDHVVIDHPQLGRIRLTLDQLEIDTGTPPPKGLFGTKFMRGWTRTISAGLNGKQGNSVNSNLTLGLNLGYDDPFKRWRIDGRYFFNRDEDGVSENNGIVNVRRDWLFPESDWFAAIAFRYQYDQFESWVHRTVFWGGPGYHLVRRGPHALDLLLGPAFNREFGERQTSNAEAVLGVDYKWSPAERYSFRFSNQIFTGIAPDAGAIRNMTIADFTIALFKEPALSFKIGIQNEYETDPEEDDKPNDLKYYMSLGLDW